MTMKDRLNEYLSTLPDAQLEHHVGILKKLLVGEQESLDENQKIVGGYSKEEIKSFNENAKRVAAAKNKRDKIASRLSSGKKLSPLQRAKLVNALGSAESVLKPLEKWRHENAEPYFTAKTLVSANKDHLREHTRELRAYETELVKRRKARGEDVPTPATSENTNEPTYEKAGEALNDNFSNTEQSPDASPKRPQRPFQFFGYYDNAGTVDSKSVLDANALASQATNWSTSSKAEAYRKLEEEGSAPKISFARTHNPTRYNATKKNLLERRRQTESDVRAYEKAKQTGDWSALEPKYQNEEEYQDAVRQKKQEYEQKKERYAELQEELKKWEEEGKYTSDLVTDNPFSGYSRRGRAIKKELKQVQKEGLALGKEGRSLIDEKPTLFKEDDWQKKLQEKYEKQVGELQEIDEGLKELKKGVVGWTTEIERAQEFTKLANKALEETGKAIDENGNVNEKYNFSPEVRTFINSDKIEQSDYEKAGTANNEETTVPDTKPDNYDDEINLNDYDDEINLDDYDDEINLDDYDDAGTANSEELPQPSPNPPHTPRQIHMPTHVRFKEQRSSSWMEGSPDKQYVHNGEDGYDHYNWNSPLNHQTWEDYLKDKKNNGALPLSEDHPDEVFANGQWISWDEFRSRVTERLNSQSQSETASRPEPSSDTIPPLPNQTDNANSDDAGSANNEETQESKADGFYGSDDDPFKGYNEEGEELDENGNVVPDGKKLNPDQKKKREEARNEFGLPEWEKHSNRYFKKRKIISAQVRKATKAIFQQMVANPGASKEYILEKAREAEPTISKGVFEAPYHNVREALSEEGVVTPDMNDRAGQNIVDANLRAQEMQGWSDEKKVEEYDRLVKEGKIEAPRGAKASAWEKINPFSQFNKKKTKYEGRKSVLENEIQQIQDAVASGRISQGDGDKKIKETREKLDAVNKILVELKNGVAESVSDFRKINLINESIEKTLEETNKAIDENGAGDSTYKFSEETQRVVDAGGTTDSVVEEGGKKRRKTKREKESREQIFEDLFADKPEVKEYIRDEEAKIDKKNASRTTKWTAQGAKIGESVGRFFGGAQGAASFAKFGASIGAAAGGLAAFLGPLAAAVAVVGTVVKVFNKLYSAANQAAEKMLSFGQYDSNLFVANMMHRGREYQRNVRFAHGTSQSGTELIETMDDAKDSMQPILIAWTNFKNKVATWFFGVLKAITDRINAVGELFSEAANLFKSLPGSDVILSVFKAAVKNVSPLLVAFRAFAAATKYITGAIENVSAALKAIRLKISHESMIDEERKKEEEESEKKREGVRAGDYDASKGDYTAYDADDSGLTDEQIEERRKSDKQTADEFREERSSKKVRWYNKAVRGATRAVGRAATGVGGFLFGEAAGKAVENTVGSWLTVDGVNDETIRDSAEYRHDLGNIQKAKNDLREGKYVSQEEVAKANEGKGTAGLIATNAGVIDGVASTKESQERLIEIGRNNGEDVKKEGEILRQQGDMYQTFLENKKDINAISDEDILKRAELMGGKEALNAKLNPFYIRNTRKKLEKEFKENTEENEAALILSNIDKDEKDRYKGDLQTISKEQFQGTYL